MRETIIILVWGWVFLWGMGAIPLSRDEGISHRRVSWIVLAAATVSALILLG